MADTGRCDRNALLALHFGEGEAGDAREHVQGCTTCRAYLDDLARVEAALRVWEDAPAPAEWREPLLAQATQVEQSTGWPRREPSAAGLLALPPAMVAALATVLYVGGRLESLWYLEWLDGWPLVQLAAPFAAASVALVVAGGLASLAIAPVLVLESRKS